MNETDDLTRSARVRPWAALILPPSAWYVFEVGLSSVLKTDCQSAGGWPGLAWGLASLALCCAAIAIARPVAGFDRGEAAPRAWLARIAMLLAGIFSLAIAFQTLSIMIVPSCIG